MFEKQISGLLMFGVTVRVRHKGRVRSLRWRAGKGEERRCVNLDVIMSRVA